jgi:hypothetical protein
VDRPILKALSPVLRPAFAWTIAGRRRAAEPACNAILSAND